jgi:DNA processing protein
LALCRVKGVRWPFLAREAQRLGGLERLLEGSASETSLDAEKSLALIVGDGARLDEHRDDVSRILEGTEAEGIQLTTVLDDDYPINLRTIYNPPPFLFYRGELRRDDAWSVAVVGRRDPSAAGVRRTRKMAKGLAQASVTVLSGLARGIDTAAHTACLAAGGRTIAVLGSGIRHVYPPENAALAEKICRSGAVVSQFWPDAAPTRITFPQRNVVTSGMGQGTVVIEASGKSGARMQARFAMQQGKLVFLLPSLTQEHAWARKFVEKGAIEVQGVEQVVEMLRSPESIQEQTDNRRQLTLALA